MNELALIFSRGGISRACRCEEGAQTRQSRRRWIAVAFGLAMLATQPEMMLADLASAIGKSVSAVERAAARVVAPEAAWAWVVHADD